LYRTYLLNESGRILQGDYIEAPDDISALDAANRFAIGHPPVRQETVVGVEVWLDRKLLFIGVNKTNAAVERFTS